MRDTTNNMPADGRMIVLLLILSGILVFDVTLSHQWSFLTETKGRNFRSELALVAPNKLVVENCSNAGTKHITKSIPAIYTPYFFELIPINSADKDMLMSVKGIGPALAHDIVAYRQQIGPFRKSTDLLNLRGIGPKRASKFATAFTFNEVP